MFFLLFPLPLFFEWPLLATHCGILHQIKKPRKKREGTKFPFSSQRKREITQSLLLFYPSPKIPTLECTFSRLSSGPPPNETIVPPPFHFPCIWRWALAAAENLIPFADFTTESGRRRRDGPLLHVSVHRSTCCLDSGAVLTYGVSVLSDGDGCAPLRRDLELSPRERSGHQGGGGEAGLGPELAPASPAAVGGRGGRQSRADAAHRRGAPQGGARCAGGRRGLRHGGRALHPGRGGGGADGGAPLRRRRAGRNGRRGRARALRKRRLLRLLLAVPHCCAFYAIFFALSVSAAPVAGAGEGRFCAILGILSSFSVSRAIQVRLRREKTRRRRRPFSLSNPRIGYFFLLRFFLLSESTFAGRSPYDPLVLSPSLPPLLLPLPPPLSLLLFHQESITCSVAVVVAAAAVLVFLSWRERRRGGQGGLRTHLRCCLDFFRREKAQRNFFCSIVPFSDKAAETFFFAPASPPLFFPLFLFSGIFFSRRFNFCFRSLFSSPRLSLFPRQTFGENAKVDRGRKGEGKREYFSLSLLFFFFALVSSRGEKGVRFVCAALFAWDPRHISKLRAKAFLASHFCSTNCSRVVVTFGIQSGNKFTR